MNTSSDLIVLAPKDLKPQPLFRASLAALELADLLKAERRPLRLLDIGGGHGIHANFFRSQVPNLTVDIVDVAEGQEPLTFLGDYLDYQPDAPYDVIWSSHVLEHQRNIGIFLDKMYFDLRLDGFLAVTVPPHINDRGILIHLTTWDPMLLIINLVHAQFDCTDGRFARYGYNISGIARKTSRADLGRVGKLLPQLPKEGYRMRADFDFWNWTIKKVHTKAAKFDNIEVCCESLNAESNPQARFVFAGSRPYYLDPVRRWLLAVN